MPEALAEPEDAVESVEAFVPVPVPVPVPVAGMTIPVGVESPSASGVVPPASEVVPEVAVAAPFPALVFVPVLVPVPAVPFPSSSVDIQ